MSNNQNQIQQTCSGMAPRHRDTPHYVRLQTAGETFIIRRERGLCRFCRGQMLVSMADIAGPALVCCGGLNGGQSTSLAGVASGSAGVAGVAGGSRGAGGGRRGVGHRGIVQASCLQLHRLGQVTLDSGAGGGVGGELLMHLRLQLLVQPPGIGQLRILVFGLRHCCYVVLLQNILLDMLLSCLEVFPASLIQSQPLAVQFPHATLKAGLLRLPASDGVRHLVLQIQRLGAWQQARGDDRAACPGDRVHIAVSILGVVRWQSRRQSLFSGVDEHISSLLERRNFMLRLCQPLGKRLQVIPDVRASRRLHGRQLTAGLREAKARLPSLLLLHTHVSGLLLECRIYLRALKPLCKDSN
mmetsp:Transcript_12374/g.37253  ORF Transcript_12374/g.37253 Transcript_12374/m.37253 type:complete len:356 (+) Transcript_12374:1911-2978(+)